MTWSDMIPALDTIDQMIAATPRPASWRDYERIKARLAKLVGFYAGDAPEALRTAEAYEVGCRHIADGLGL